MAERSAFRSHISTIVLTAAGIAALAGITSGRVHAQSAPGGIPPPPPAAQMAPSQPRTLGVNDPRNPLHLTAAQQKKVLAIQTKYQPQVQAIAQNSSLKMQQKQAMLASLSKKANAELTAILTPAQRVQMQKMQKVAKAQQALIMQRQTQIQKLEAQFQKSLTADQKKKLNALSAQFQPQVNKLQADTKMTPQQKQVKMMAMGQSYSKQEENILSSTQKAILKKIRQIQTEPLTSASH